MARTNKAKKVQKVGDGKLEYCLKAGVGSHRVRGGVKMVAGDSLFIDNISELGSFADKFELVSGMVQREEEKSEETGLRRLHMGFGKYSITEIGSEEPLHKGTMYKAAAVAIVDGGHPALEAWIAEQK